MEFEKFYSSFLYSFLELKRGRGLSIIYKDLTETSMYSVFIAYISRNIVLVLLTALGTFGLPCISCSSNYFYSMADPFQPIPGL